MWIEKRGRQYRVYWRNHRPDGPMKSFEPFANTEQAQTFIELARLTDLAFALAYVRDPSPEALAAAFAMPAAATGREAVYAPPVATAEAAVAGITPASASTLDQYSPAVGLTFDALWARFLEQLRHLEGTTVDLYEGYGAHHLLPFFGGVDIGLVQRARPLRERDAHPDAVYVDDWVTEMLSKERLNNVGLPMAGKLLSIKFIKNVLIVLANAFDLALQARPVLLTINPAREIRLPKQDRREMFFLEDATAYLALREAMEEHFRPLLDFLVGTGARFGEAAGLLVRHLHLDAERPYVEIRLILKWARKRWKLGRPKTRASIRRITLSPFLAEILRPLVEGKNGEEHVFTMVQGGALHHGNFYKRYFRPAVEAAGASVPRRLRIHDLRHTHAAWLLSDGVPAFAVQRRLGHSTSRTTQDVYGHFTPEADDRTLALIDRRLPAIFDSTDPGAELVQLSKSERALPEFDVDDDDDLAA